MVLGGSVSGHGLVGDGAGVEVVGVLGVGLVVVVMSDGGGGLGDVRAAGGVGWVLAVGLLSIAGALGAVRSGNVAGSVAGRSGMVGRGGARVNLRLGTISSEVTTPFGGLSGEGDSCKSNGEVGEHVYCSVGTFKVMKLNSE